MLLKPGVEGFECVGVLAAEPDPGTGTGGGVQGSGPRAVGVGGRGAVGAE